MIQLRTGQTFLIDDELIANFPWFELDFITRLTVEWHSDPLPSVEMIVTITSQPDLVACLKLQSVSKCNLPVMGSRRLQFSQMMIENVRSRQLEGIYFEIRDEDYYEPLIQFKSGEVQI